MTLTMVGNQRRYEDGKGSPICRKEKYSHEPDEKDVSSVERNES
jgi:hypothetical protein